MTISRRIWLLALQFTVAAMVVSAIGHWNLSRLSESVRTLGQTDIVLVKEVAQLQRFHDGLAARVYRAMHWALKGEVQRIAELKGEADGIVQSMQTSLAKVEALNLMPTEKAKFSAAKSSLETYAGSCLELLNGLIIRGAKAGTVSTMDFESNFRDVDERLEAFRNSVQSTIDSDIGSALGLSNSAQRVAWIASILGILAGLAAAGFYIHSISKSLNGLASSFDQAANQICEVSLRIRSSSSVLSDSTAEHSAAIEETVASMEEMGSMIAQTNQNASRATQESSHGLDDARKGQLVVSEMVEAMKKIADANEQLQEIVRIIDTIKTKTAVINEIAFETRLLAFNASIEAARAGAHGRGFAVVAEEVGKLANVSDKAADEVKTLLESSVSKVKAVVGETKRMTEEGRSISKLCQESFSRVESAMNEVSNGIQRIAAAAKEQEIGVRQANKAMVSMERVTQANLKNAENLAGQGEALSRAVDEFHKSADTLHLLVHNRQLLLRASSAQLTASSEKDSSRGRGSPSPGPTTDLNRAANSDSPSEMDRHDNRWNAA